MQAVLLYGLAQGFTQSEDVPLPHHLFYTLRAHAVGQWTGFLMIFLS